jgi:hypothetical protein
MKINICTLSDFNFLAKGLSLYDSLVKYNKDLVLHYLCTDSKSYDKLKDYECETLKVYIDEFSNPDLDSLKQEDPEYYFYCLSSYFSYFIMKSKDCDVTYVDSDIIFYDGIQIILNEIGEKDVGIFRHRQYPFNFPNNNGFFNVGVVHFKNTELGNNILNWWSDAVLHRKYPELATCGDQKYLDAFLGIPEENLFIDGNIGHGAPWQWQLYDYSEYFNDGSIIWNGEKQKLLFSHFSNFDYNLEKDEFTPAVRHSPYTPQNLYKEIKELGHIHQEYFTNIKKTIAKYNLKG